MQHVTLPNYTKTLNRFKFWHASISEPSLAPDAQINRNLDMFARIGGEKTTRHCSDMKWLILQEKPIPFTFIDELPAIEMCGKETEEKGQNDGPEFDYNVENTVVISRKVYHNTWKLFTS